MNLSDKVIIVTGASRGIGLVTAQQLTKSCAHVFGVSRQVLKQGDIAEGVRMLRADVRVRTEVYQAVKTVIDEAGHVDVLINNAGVEYVKPIDETTDQEYDDMLDTNLKGAFYFTKAVLPYMRRQKSGHLVFINSISGIRGFTDDAVYCASKHGLTGLADALDEELRSQGIHVTSIHPGATSTAFALETWAPVDDPRRSFFLRAEDIASAVLYAVSLPSRVVVKQIVIQPMIELPYSDFLPVEVIQDLPFTTEETTE